MKKMNINGFFEEIQKIGYIIEEHHEDPSVITLLFDRSGFCLNYPLYMNRNKIVYIISLFLQEDICLTRQFKTVNILDVDFSFEKVIKDLTDLMAEYKQLQIKRRKDQLEADFM